MNKGTCAICGEHKELSFEHYPPKKAFNNKPINIKGYDNLFNEMSTEYGRKTKSPKGFGSHTLCKKCNNETGDWYARDYINWTKQGVDLIKKNNENFAYPSEFSIKPLNVLKQVMAMFLSANKSGILSNHSDLKKFILERESQVLLDNYRIYLYLNNSKIKRFLGLSIVSISPSIPICKWSEISFPPFGFLLTDNSPPANKFQYDITFFKNYKYEEEAKLQLPLSYLEVPNEFIGTYKNIN